MINTIKNIIEKRDMVICIGTHSGIFHCDDVMAVAMIAILTKNVNVIRSRDEETLKMADLLVDVGYGTYDHHQPGGNGVRNDEKHTKYASAGLIWRDFGELIVKLLSKGKLNEKEVHFIVNYIDQLIVKVIDNEDNGVNEDNDHPFKFISLFLPNWYEDDDKMDYDGSFEECVNIVVRVFERAILEIIEKAPQIMSKRETQDSPKEICTIDDILSTTILSTINDKYEQQGIIMVKNYHDVKLNWDIYGEDIVRFLNDTRALTDDEVKAIAKSIRENYVNLENESARNFFRFVSPYLSIINNKKATKETRKAAEECLEIVKSVFKHIVLKTISNYLAFEEITARFTNNETRKENILIIPKQVFPWQYFTIDYNDKNPNNPVDFVVFPYPKPTGGYALQSVPKSVNNMFSKRIPLPKSWTTAKEMLPEVSGIASATFCHSAGFFARTKEFDDALEMCMKATYEFTKNGTVK